MRRFLFLLTGIILSCNSLFSQTYVQNVNIIDVKTGKIIPNQTVFILNNKIEEVGNAKDINPMRGARIIDGQGKYLMPGLIDAHIHFFQSGGLYTRPDALDLRFKVPYHEEKKFAKSIIKDHFNRYLKFGITTVVDVGGPFSNFSIRDSLAKKVVSPNVWITGPIFSPYVPKNLGNDDPPIIKVSNEKEAETMYNKMIQYKPDIINVWFLDIDDYPAKKFYPILKLLGELAHHDHIKMAVHATSLKTARMAVEAEADILVHSIDDEVISDDFIKSLKPHNITYIPAMLVNKNFGDLSLLEKKHHPLDLKWANPDAYMSLFDLAGLSSDETPQRLKSFRKNKANYLKKVVKEDSIRKSNLLKLVNGKINVAVGSDAGNIGTMHASSYMQELMAMKSSGISNANILKAATITAAIAYDKDKYYGSVEVGKIADLILLSANPISDINNLNMLDNVIKGGRVIDHKNLIKESPKDVVQKQLLAYNARNIEAFMDTYSEDVKILDYTGKVLYQGKEKMTNSYKSLFDQTTNLFCKIKNRIIIGNKVIDQEYVRMGDKYVDAVAIYEVTNGKISKVTFVK